MERCACLEVERTAVVEFLLVGFGHGKAHAFHCVDVDNYGMVDVLDRAEHFNQALKVVAVVYVAVAVAHRAEEVGLGGAVGVAEQTEVGVNSAVVLGYAHLVVVDDDDEVRAERSAVVETFECHAAAERAVANHGHHIFLASLKVARFGQTCGQSYGRRCVSERIEVVVAFGRIGVAGHVVVMGRVGESLHTAREHFMGIGLMGDIEYDFVLWSVEHVV